MDEFGYVYATVPSNSPKEVPTICFCSHMDVSPDAPSANIKPIVHENYQGGDLHLPGDPTYNILASDNPDLALQIGNDIITSDGTTLLGADDKAGCSIILDVVQTLRDNPQIQHGTIKLLFTPDEEIARGPDKADLKKLGAQFGYTVDGEELGSIEDETFSADMMVVQFFGRLWSPGSALGEKEESSLENSMKAAAEFLKLLPRDRLTPSTTQGSEGFIHPIGVSGNNEQTTVKFIIRDFTVEGLVEKEEFVKQCVEETMKKFPKSTSKVEVITQYRNMKEIVDKFPFVVEYAERALKRIGVTPIRKKIRGGTDGSRFSFMGMPCPNLFDGSHNFHSRQEWCSIQDMKKGVECVVNIIMIWEEEAK